MKYNFLGNSGLKVSEYCLGSMTWGEASSEKTGHWQLDAAIEHGINFVDTAEMYPTNPMRRETAGKTEKIIGTWIKKRKHHSDVVIATKITGEGSATVRDGSPITKNQIRKSLDESLSRLNAEYVDLYQLHWPNRGSYHFRKYWNYNPTSQISKEMDDHVQEVLSVSSDLIREGKIRALGLSNESAWGTMKFISGVENDVAFYSVLQGLEPGRKYYVRAFASNLEGVGYGFSISFETAGSMVWPSWSDAQPMDAGEGWWSSSWFGTF